MPFSGSVRYIGHGGVLDVALGNPSIVVQSASSATLYFNGGSFASLDLSAASKQVAANGAVTWSGVPASLTANGASYFAGYYSAGQALDSLTFTAGSPGSGGGGGTTIVAAAIANPVRTPAPAPPAKTGVSVVGSMPDRGGEITIEAAGFQPNEPGVIIVIYSDPVLLGTVDADAAGVARWTGRLPAALSGSHTLTIQGSVSRGVVVNILPAAPVAAGSCTVTGATLTWGFKESFRSYISGTIANGEWTVAGGASYGTPSFSWQGSGQLDPEAGTGDLAFTGSVRFTGHDGALDTTIANPRVLITGDEAVLLLDVIGTTQAGDPVSAVGVEFASLDLSGAKATTTNGVESWAGVPAVLTAAGAAAFGTYPEGESVDPIDLSVEPPAGCGEATAPEPTRGSGVGLRRGAGSGRRTRPRLDLVARRRARRARGHRRHGRRRREAPRGLSGCRAGMPDRIPAPPPRQPTSRSWTSG